MTHDQLKIINGLLKKANESLEQIEAEAGDLVIDGEEVYRQTLAQHAHLKTVKAELMNESQIVNRLIDDWRREVLDKYIQWSTDLEMCARSVNEMLKEYERQNPRPADHLPPVTCEGFTDNANEPNT